MEEKLNLQQDFAPVSAQQWKDKIIADLKGPDFDKKLVWRTHGRLLTASSLSLPPRGSLKALNPT